MSDHVMNIGNLKSSALCQTWLLIKNLAGVQETNQISIFLEGPFAYVFLFGRVAYSGNKQVMTKNA